MPERNRWPQISPDPLNMEPRMAPRRTPARKAFPSTSKTSSPPPRTSANARSLNLPPNRRLGETAVRSTSRTRKAAGLDVRTRRPSGSQVPGCGVGTEALHQRFRFCAVSGRAGLSQGPAPRLPLSQLTSATVDGLWGRGAIAQHFVRAAATPLATSIGGGRVPCRSDLFSLRSRSSQWHPRRAPVPAKNSSQSRDAVDDAARDTERPEPLRQRRSPHLRAWTSAGRLRRLRPAGSSRAL